MIKNHHKNIKSQIIDEEKVAVITGTSSGIGFETALAFAREGYYTYATMRNTSKSDNIKEISQEENLKIDVLELDVDKEHSVKTAIKQILDQKQRIDVLVNNAGWGIWGCVEDVSIDEFKAPFGINVIVLEPGIVNTNFFKPMKMAKKLELDTAYKAMTDKIIPRIISKAKLGIHPQEVATIIIDAVKSEIPLQRYHVGDDAAKFLEARRSKTDIELENYIKKRYAYGNIRLWDENSH